MVKTMELLQELTSVTGVPGFEEEVRQVLRRHLEDYGNIEVDRLGCIIGKKRGTSATPRVMLAAHMDEIGFMVKAITSDGFLKFIPLGGWWDQVLLAQPVVIKGRKGDVPGIIGSNPPHLLDEEERKKMVKKKDMFIDVGAKDRAEVESFGIRPGDPIVPASNFIRMKNDKLLLAKAWDDRAGCALLVEVLQNLANSPHPNTVYAVGTVQEEVGTRGAATSVKGVDPDVALVLEVSIAGDVPGLKEEVPEKLGGGPGICLYDASMLPNRKLRDLVLEIAEEEGIPYQYSILERGGTDGGKIHIHGLGVPSLVIGIPVRYIHSHSGIMDLDDFSAAAKLITAVLKRLDQRTVRELVT